MSLDKDTIIRQLQEQLVAMEESMLNSETGAAPTFPLYGFVPSKNYLFRLLAHYWVGEVVAVFSTGMCVLRNASWIPDTGQYNKCLTEGADAFNHVEPAPGLVFINLKALGDAAEWTHELPDQVKQGN